MMARNEKLNLQEHLYVKYMCNCIKCCAMNYFITNNGNRLILFQFSNKEDHTFHRIYCVNAYTVKMNSINIHIKEIWVYPNHRFNDLVYSILGA